MKKTYLILSVLFLFLCTTSHAVPIDEISYFKKHVIIIVDQTEVQNNGDMQLIFNELRNLLLNKEVLNNNSNNIIPENLFFNPNTDELSLYAFGLAGHDFSNTPYGNISEDCRMGVSPEIVSDKIIENLIYKRQTYRTSECSNIEQFIDRYLEPLFSKGDSLYKTIKANSGITLSYYVYPSILKVIDTTIPTQEYHIIIVSDYKSGTTNKDTDDLKRLRDLTHHQEQYIKQFQKQMNSLKGAFYQIEDILISFGDTQEAPMAKGFYLKLRSLETTQAYVNSNLSIKETDYNKTTYIFSGIDVSFNHNEDDISIYKIVLNITDESGNICYTKEYPIKYNADNTYSIEGGEIDLGKVFKVGDKLNVESILYATAKDASGNSIMPLVFIAERDYELSSNDIINKHQAKKRVIMYYILEAILIILLIYIAYYIYKKRGKTKKVSIDFVFWPITNTRFMEVKEKKVISYDCWYWRNGERDKNIFVKGKVNIEKKKFAKKYNYIVEYLIEDIDLNDDFSFRPDTKIREKDGSERKAKFFYPVSYDSNEGDFNFNVNAYMAPELSSPNFDRENILSVKVLMRVVLISGNTKEYITNVSHKYNFIVKPDIENSNLWVAFDPGTSGSCIAYGATGNPNDKNDIFLAENEYEDIRGEKLLTPIFPSKIRINKQSAKLFKSDIIKAEELEEGDDKDFLFGNQAEILWNKTGVNSFQSIKKLLGYTTPQRIVGAQKEIKEISGQDLAHMLVRGLYNHFEEYLKKGTSDDAVEIQQMFIKNGKLVPQRAIVAVPNNYTLVKIQEMVDSIKRLNKFDEVHYIYESEAVIMSYFRRNWDRLESLQDKIFMVYDMGGATINTTAFSVKVNIEFHKGNKYIRNIDVRTLAKIGYGIGGDDIDFAIINIVYKIPTIKAYFENNNIDIEKHQRKNKSELITLARRIKLDFIEKERNLLREGNIMSDNEKLYGHIREFFNNKFGFAINNVSDEDIRFLSHEMANRRIISSFVLDNVKDAVKELLISLPSSNKNLELIMSGRSVLYPGIKESVISAIGESGFQCDKPWDGFNDNDGNFDAQQVKSAVAVGACWYAMYSNRINIQHNQVTSTFGYIDIVNMKQKFIPIITRENQFDETGSVAGHAEPKDPKLNHIKFIQMLGSNYDEILNNEIRHKMNLLDVVYQTEITSMIDEIKIALDDKGNFSYEIQVAGKSEPITIDSNPHSRLTGRLVKMEITDENSPAYLFATLNALEEDENLKSDDMNISVKKEYYKSERNNKNNTSNNKNNNKGRF